MSSFTRCRECGELDKPESHRCSTLWECELVGVKGEGCVGEYHGQYHADAAAKLVKKWDTGTGRVVKMGELVVRVRAKGTKRKWKTVKIGAYVDTLYYERV